ncbi:MAG: DUF4126 domain-containing protein [Acidobacteriota bacterium]
MEADLSVLETLLTISLGLGLAAACGFRVFVPPLVLSAAGISGWLELSGAEWMATWPAFTVFAVATVLEVLAYYVPWVDNLLDTVSTPAAVVAGAVVSFGVFQGMDPTLEFVLAAVGGGGTAALSHGAMALTRSVSSVTTGGIANPLVATAELGGAVGVSVLSILAPIFGVVVFLVLLVALALMLRRVRGQEEGAAAIA